MFLTLFLLSVFVVFFVSKDFNPVTQKREFNLTAKWVKSFKKWLDVYGWSRLVYKVDFSKYEDLYKDQPSVLLDAKKNVKEIILKNIDDRISSLWVSDYNSYEQNIEDETYIVVEIWGISDLDYAKSIIWKTVELEFKLPNKEDASEEVYADRKNKADLILVDATKTPEKLKELVENRGSENIEYHNFTWVNILQLPEIFQKNENLLNSMEKWSLYPEILEWTYHTIVSQDMSWNNVETILNGFTMFRLKDRNIQVTEEPNIQDVLLASKKFNLEYNQNIKKTVSVNTWSYVYSNWEFVYNLGTFADWIKAYEVEIYSVEPIATFWLSGDELAQKEKEYSELLSKIEDWLTKWQNLDLSWVVLAHSGWLDLSSLQQTLSEFDDQENGSVKKYKQSGQDVFVKVKDIKSEKDTIYQIVSISMDSKTRSDFEKFMKEKTIYTIEDVFVYDKEVWIPALDTKTNKILNWAFFRMASVGSNSVWAPAVNITFDDQWKEIFCNITKENIWEQMAIFIWWEIKTWPVIRSQICDWNAIIEWNYTPQEVKELVDDLNSWTLPAPLTLMQEEKISPTLWEDALQWALIAGLVWVLAIFVMVFLMYGLRKAIISISVLIFFIMVLLMMLKVIDYSLSLSGIAAIILSIGMWVDANILIFERVREELRSWKTLNSAIETWYSRSLSPIRDWNISTWIIALLLFSFGVNMFKWFGAMMILNMILILLINVPLTKVLLHIVFHNKKVYIKEDWKIKL